VIGALHRISGAASRLVAYLAVAMIVLGAVLTAVDVFFRSALRMPIFGTNDIVVLALTLGVTGCFPYALAVRHHMKVEVVGRRLGARAYWTLEVFAGLATTAVLAAFAIEFAARAGRLARMNEASQLLLIPLSPIWWVSAGLMAIAAAAQIVVVLENAHAVAVARGFPAAGET
jgi:TRAP-type C4-dicarboxylate transport system permease small subunit